MIAQISCSRHCENEAEVYFVVFYMRMSNPSSHPT